MDNQNLSVCIPSNRKFAASKEAYHLGLVFVKLQTQS